MGRARKDQIVATLANNREITSARGLTLLETKLAKTPTSFFEDKLRKH
jgi:hypothetical protein